MPKYRKKPIVIEAREYPDPKAHKELAEAIRIWCGGENIKNKMVIKTLEGDMECSVGDMIIKGVNGEFYPCKSDIFKQTYDLIG